MCVCAFLNIKLGSRSGDVLVFDVDLFWMDQICLPKKDLVIYEVLKESGCGEECEWIFWLYVSATDILAVDILATDILLCQG